MNTINNAPDWNKLNMPTIPEIQGYKILSSGISPIHTPNRFPQFELGKGENLRAVVTVFPDYISLSTFEKSNFKDTFSVKNGPRFPEEEKPYRKEYWSCTCGFKHLTDEDDYCPECGRTLIDLEEAA